jgi:hypothetical protein
MKKKSKFKMSDDWQSKIPFIRSTPPKTDIQLTKAIEKSWQRSNNKPDSGDTP